MQGTGASWSKLGSEAQNTKLGEPTMVLDLSNCSGDYQKKATILHEFGHALGLGHEHQHPEYCSVMEKYLDEKQVQVCSGIYDTEVFIENYHPIEGDDVEKSHYDAGSIMHYP